MGQIGRWLVGVGIGVAVVGGILMLAGRAGLGRLPGDLRFGSGGTRVYIPLATCVLVSIVATIVLNLFFRR
jgi:hypothetical protein